MFRYVSHNGNNTYSNQQKLVISRTVFSYYRKALVKNLVLAKRVSPLSGTSVLAPLLHKLYMDLFGNVMKSLYKSLCLFVNLFFFNHLLKYYFVVFNHSAANIISYFNTFCLLLLIKFYHKGLSSSILSLDQALAYRGPFFKLLNIGVLKYSSYLSQVYYSLYFHQLPSIHQSVLNRNLISFQVYPNSIFPADSSWDTKNINFNLFIYKFISKLLVQGKKSIATKHIFELFYFHKLNNLLKGDSYILGSVFDAVAPKFKLVNLKFRGRNRLVPKLVNSRKMVVLGIGLFLQGIKSRSEKGIVSKMFNEVLDIYALKGNTLKLKELNYKTGIANRQLLFRKSSRKVRKIYNLKKHQYYLG